MKRVTFPFVNLTFGMNPIAFTIFGIPVYWYAIFIVASIILALFLCYKKNGKYGIKYQDILDLSLILLPISFLGARIYYILFNLNNYTSWKSMFSIKNGGLAIYGGLIAGGITIYYFCKKRSISYLDVLDYVAPVVALGQAIGRLGNFINVEAYGTKTDVLWKMGVLEQGVWQYVHPTFLYESICTIAIFVILSILSHKRKYSGQITFWYVLLYSFCRMIIEGFRSDSLFFFSLRISQVVSFFLFVTFCSILIQKSEILKIIQITIGKRRKKSHEN